MPNVLEVSKLFIDRLQKREDSALKELRDVYIPVLESLLEKLEELVEEIVKRQQANKIITRTQLYQSTRLTEVLKQFTEEINKANKQSVYIITSGQRDAVELALESSRELIKSAVGKIPSDISFDRAFLRFDEEAAKQIVARFSEASPIRKSLEASIPSGIAGMDQLFVKAIVDGVPPKALISPLMTNWGMSFIRAETTARTEIVSSYRDGNLVRYDQSLVVKQWQWSATLDERTCPVCVYMDGKIFDLDQPFATHPNCRCSPIPVTKTWAELGIDAPEFKPDLGLRGEQWFKAQSAERQFNILKKSKFELYQSGDITLEDLVQFFEHSVYGPSREERSIKDLKRLQII